MISSSRISLAPGQINCPMELHVEVSALHGAPERGGASYVFITSTAWCNARQLVTEKVFEKPPCSATEYGTHSQLSQKQAKLIRHNVHLACLFVGLL